MGGNPTPADLAARLTDKAGLPKPSAVEQLVGGRNNRVFKVHLGDDRFVVLKIYHKDPLDTRDRLGAEWRFLEYAWRHGVRAIPEPITFDAQENASLIGFIDGRRMTAKDVDATAIQAALDFIASINAAPRDTDAIELASEAHFSLAAHIEAVQGRVDQLTALDPEAPSRAETETFVTDLLEPRWLAVKAAAFDAAESLGLLPDTELPMDERCISPSDFGFHNVLRRRAQTIFIDFEYAGLDDPAKLICDFLCQPEIPIPAFHHDRFIVGVLTGLGLPPRHGQRATLLLDVYRIKWMCIMLNDFLPGGERRRTHADQAPRAERCARQLAKASRAFAALGNIRTT